MVNDERREILIANNRREYGRDYDFLVFPTPEQAMRAHAERDELLAWLRNNAEFSCNDTKVDGQKLSPGCQTCAIGAWSCLFINGRCNVSCFYCPTPQDQTDKPLSNGIPFATPDDYADYIALFGFTGASISGGEPLLTLDRTLAYLTAVRRRCGDAVHLWMYTNGTLLTKEIAEKLLDAGLGEIRFDIGAVNYDLSTLKLAVGIIPTVTVEIPAVPEEEERLRSMLAEMAESGVQHLNLHQMRLTPHNLRHLANRDYTFVHGEKVTVLESELAALRLVQHAIKYRIDLPVNYCSFPYKRRFQHAAARSRGIKFIQGEHETVTEAGYLRVLGAGSVQYFEAVTLPDDSNRHSVFDIPLSSGSRIIIEKRPVSPLIHVDSSLFNDLSSLTSLPEELRIFEKISFGLSDYF